MLNVLLFAALPYVSVVLFLLVSIQRYRRDPFTFSSLSSQFLETKELFWGSVPFHLGILTLFFGHLVGFLFPRGMTLWNGVPIRLFLLESTALAAALLTLFGLGALIVRRAAAPRGRFQTTSWFGRQRYGTGATRAWTSRVKLKTPRRTQAPTTCICAGSFRSTISWISGWNRTRDQRYGTTVCVYHALPHRNVIATQRPVPISNRRRT